MLGAIVGFEWRYATRRLTFLAAVVMFFGMGLLLASTGFGPDEVRVNGPYSIALSSGFLTLVSVFALTVICAPALLRDVDHRMEEIVYATAVPKAHHLGGRFLGSFLAVCAAFLCALPGLVVGSLLLGAEYPSRLGPFHPADYLWPLLVLVLPNLLFVAALLFAVAAITRSTLATYVAGVFIYVLYFVAALFTSSPIMASTSPPTPEGLAFAALFDPFALSAFFEQTQYWTAVERDARRVTLSGHLLHNRILWLTMTGLVLALTHRLFAFRVVASAKAAKRELTEATPRAHVYRSAPVGPARWGAWWSATRLEVRFLTRSWPFLALLLLWVAGTFIEMVQTFRSAEFGTALLPTTGLLLGEITTSLRMFGLILLVYFTAESAWRERAVHVAEVVDATPAGNGVFFAAKAAALSLLVVILTALAIVVGMVFQLACGYTRLEPGLFASLFYFVGAPLVLFAVLALLVQTVTPNRHVGLLATLAAGVVWHRGSLGGPDHPLLRYAATVEVPYSALGGLSPASLSFHWFTAYWTAFAGLIALLALGLWRRGAEAPLLTRLNALPRHLGRRSRVAAAACGLVCAGLGAAVFQQTNVLNAYETGEELLVWKAAYERSYRHLETSPQPHLVHVHADVALFPEERRYRVQGRYTLENRTGQPLRTVWATVRRDVARATLSLAGKRPSTTDARFGTRSFVLDPPLPPGARTYLDFEVAVERRAAHAEGADHDMVRNGSFVLSTTAFPTLGYRRTYEIVRAAERRRQGLPPRAEDTDEAAAAGLSGRDDERITFDVTVSTSADQTVIAPGTLDSTWEHDGRRYARFSATRRVRPYLAFASARYAVEKIRHGGVDVEVYYHPGHATNVRHILDAATRSLDYFSTRFGPYPHPALRIAEVPSYSFSAGGLALPGVVYLVEHRAFLTDRRDPSRIDVVAKRVAHEVAHQWWGHELVPAVGPGGLVLVESLARYSELLILKELHGPTSWPAVLEVELDRYLSGRTGGDDVPLARLLDQSYIAYAKGALVMTAMHDLIGEEAVNGVLRSLMDDVRADRKPTAADLVARLRAATPEGQRGLVDQWWSEVVLYDLRVEKATAQPLPDGRHRVTLRIGAHKTRVDDKGREAPLPLDEELDVAAYADYPSPAQRGETLYLGRHRVIGGSDLEIVLPSRPGYVAVDPLVRRIDRNRADNVRKVQ